MAESLIELGRGGRMNMGQIMRLKQKNGRPGILVERVHPRAAARPRPSARQAGRYAVSADFRPSHEGRPGRDRLDTMVGVPAGMSLLERTLPQVEDWTPGPAYYPGEAPQQERVRRQSSATDIYAMSEEEISPLVREERRQVGQAEEATVKEERVLPPSRKPGEKIPPAPMPTIAKVGIALAIIAGLTTVYLGFRQVAKED